MADYLPMSAPEKKDLADLERVIESGLNTFAEVGCALLEIRDRKLHRATHGTFDDYCRERWSMTKTHANRLIAAHGVVAGMTPLGVNPPESERQARPLVGMDPEDAAEVLEEARETAAEEGRPVTAKDVDVAAVARKAGIDPAKVLPSPAEVAGKLIRGAVKRIEGAKGRLDAGPQVRVENALAEIEGALSDQGV